MAVIFTASGSPSAGGVQQSYALLHDPLLEGQLSDIRDNTIGSYINETAGVIAFGNIVTWASGGTVDKSAKTIAGTGETVLGVNVLTYVDETAKDANDRTGVKTTQAMNVLNEGAVAVYVHGSVNPSPLPCVSSTPLPASSTQVSCSSALISGKTAVLSNARYLSSVTGSGLAIVEFNGPSFTLTAD
jgi:hypothetical protein